MARSNQLDRVSDTPRPFRRFTSWKDLRQPIVFCVVGVTLALIYFVVAYTAMSAVGLDPEIASVCSYLLMIPFGYFAHRIITFRSSAVHRVAFPGSWLHQAWASRCPGSFLTWPRTCSQLPTGSPFSESA